MSDKLIKNKIPLMVILPAIWMSTVTLMLVTLIVLLFTSFDLKTDSHKYSLYASRPLVLGAMTSATGIGDPRAAKIDMVYEHYNCPMAGLGEIFVREADKNDIPYWVVAAIAFQESSCGKMTPEPDGIESYNAWGWAVYGDQVKMFNSWEHGIEVVSKYMNDRFFSQGVTDLCEIMRTYTPPSKGSWCNGVDFFGTAIDGYQTPEQ